MNTPPRILARFLIASAVALSIPLGAAAHPSMEGHGGGPLPPGGPGGPLRPGGPGGHGMIPFLHELNLSEAQQDKIFDIMHALEPQMRDRARAAHKAQRELHQMSLSDKFDEAEARVLADSASRAEADLALLRARSTQQVLATLTPEQRRQAAELKQRQKSRRPGEDGPPGPRGPQHRPGGGGPLLDHGDAH